ncbi:MAG: HepT-like ribonuclease domain-containing protein [Planctomycetota bacterium]
MLEAAETATEFADGRSRQDLDSDLKLVYALVRCIEIVGEAAKGVSQPRRERLDSLPWKDICGMRDRLIHAYFDVDSDILWATVQNDLPKVIEALREALEAGPD